ncbi:hypothetical protein [Bradyrhizobium sp. 187]|jgi:hypothetical protein|uniref:hypothetical protein n=1 Tax=Bradyrhizobium sp. 187 TaxID=2782655 RepID=UPI001FFF1B4F|nr:hypothetical protein [Bradyrhizobium sp. 187]UPJ71332.1 hypothetical protein IVB19_27415 [Bradyrhizobium sp. 187]
MKFYTLDKNLLIEVRSIKPHAEGLIIEGEIMGTMPMKAMLQQSELCAAFKLVSWAVVRRTFTMLIGASRAAQRSDRGAGSKNCAQLLSRR